MWLKVAGKKGCELLKIDFERFGVLEIFKLETKDWGPSVWFSDGEQLGIITSIRDVSIISIINFKK